MLREMIEKLVRLQDLGQDDARRAMETIMAGKATDAQIAAFITALRMKGESIDEITGAVLAMRAAAATIKVKGTLVEISQDDAVQAMETIVDTCGTGGDCTNTFNISTAVALVVAGCGLTVAKHGNRSVSSKSGSADVLEACGVAINLSPLQVQTCIQEIGLGFMFAPTFHPAMKYAIGVRREIGIRTIFNILGPLCNPANANVHILGVYDEALTEPLAMVLSRVGVKRALVVHGTGGLDEFSLLGPTKVSRINPDGDGVSTFSITPEEVGLQTCELKALQGGNAAENAAIINAILDGQPGAKTDAVLLNAGAVLWVAGRTSTLAEGVSYARQGLGSGQAKAKLEQLVALTNRLAHPEEG